MLSNKNSTFFKQKAARSVRCLFWTWGGEEGGGGGEGGGGRGGRGRRIINIIKQQHQQQKNKRNGRRKSLQKTYRLSNKCCAQSMSYRLSYLMAKIHRRRFAESAVDLSSAVSLCLFLFLSVTKKKRTRSWRCNGILTSFGKGLIVKLFWVFYYSKSCLIW